MAKLKVSCVYCGNVIERFPSECLKTIYCSRECRAKHFQENSTVVFKCDFCGKEKRIRKANYKEEGNHFCSKSCKDTWQKTGLEGENNPFYNKKHTTATRKKVSETKKSKNLTGINAHNYNSHPVECHYCGKAVLKIQYLISRSKHLFCSIECHGKWKSVNLIGENSPSWNPNLTDEERVQGRKYPEYYAFLKLVMERDEYNCQVCGKHSKWGDGLNVHHLNGYHWDGENRTNEDNGVTLCKKCHKKFHRIYGYGNNTKEQFIEYEKNHRVLFLMSNNDNADTVVTP